MPLPLTTNTSMYATMMRRILNSSLIDRPITASHGMVPGMILTLLETITVIIPQLLLTERTYTSVITI